MIRNKADYKRLLIRKLQLVNSCTNFFKLYFNPTQRFLLFHCTCEYYLNTSGNKLFYFAVKYLKYKQSLKLNFSIPENVAD